MNDCGRPSLLLQSSHLDPMLNESTMDDHQICPDGKTSTVSAAKFTVHSLPPSTEHPSRYENRFDGQQMLRPCFSIDPNGQITALDFRSVVGVNRSASTGIVHSLPISPSRGDNRFNGQQMLHSYYLTGGNGQIIVADFGSVMGVNRSASSGTVHSMQLSPPSDPMVCESMLAAQRIGSHRSPAYSAGKTTPIGMSFVVAVSSDCPAHQENRCSVDGKIIVAIVNSSTHGYLASLQRMSPLPNPYVEEYKLAAQQQHQYSGQGNNSKVWEKKSFKDILNAFTGCNKGDCSKSMATSQRKGDIMAIKVDPTEHQDRLKYFEMALIGRLIGHEHMMSSEINYSRSGSLKVHGSCLLWGKGITHFALPQWKSETKFGGLLSLLSNQEHYGFNNGHHVQSVQS